MHKIIAGIAVLFVFITSVFAQSPRQTISLDEGWQTIMDEQDSSRYQGFEQAAFVETGDWKTIDVPHNWDSYGGYRRLLRGNLFGHAWYRKEFMVKQKPQNKRFYLFFEGVGSYATVWLNGKKVGYHAGGRTTFTLDVSEAIYTDGRTNLLAVRADHPAEIRDLPWVDGGGSAERGFSEGSQPMGIFRPVSLVIKNEVNIAPFGVHYWNDETADEKSAAIQQTIEVQNTSAKTRRLTVVTNMRDAEGKKVYSSKDVQQINAHATHEFKLSPLHVDKPTLWDTENPYLYTMETIVQEGRKVLDRLETPYGIRSIRWPKGLKPVGTNQLLVNGKPIFIHGIAEYEHKLGGSHAFTAEEIAARVRDMKALGFNSFRDAHQPHNLRYQQFWDQNGILLWTQMAAHIWFDNEDFRTNFKNLLRDWVKERRNSPSVFLWGLENESTLPEDFARECTELIRSLDPTASIQRLVTTCNGGSGTDWDVPQNWTGTYGGDHNTYGEDLKRQMLVGEYGAWRTLELHAEPPYLPNHPVYSEARFTEILETKLRLADSVKGEAIGHYQWLWNSHDNPGRIQGGEGLRDLDKIGPVNYKGLLTPWGEPTDAYYMYRAHYSDKNDPMIHIASHTWPNRWLIPGIKDAIRIFSNCDEVELFNDLENISLGVQKHPGFGRPFEFNGVDIKYNVLYAEGRNGGKTVVRDTIVLFNLPQSPNFEKMRDTGSTLLKGETDVHYLYRVNSGGPEYTDIFGQHWMADQPYTEAAGWGSVSWADSYDDISSVFASQRRTFDPIKGVADWPLFQTFRYGLDQLSYHFDVPNGIYRVELYFAEPWVGGAGLKDGTAMRLFDVAINDIVQEQNLDIWKEEGHDAALKRIYEVEIQDKQLKIHFPHVAAGQAIIQAIAIASVDRKPEETKKRTHYNMEIKSGIPPKIERWMDIGQRYDSVQQLSFQQLPGFLYGADYFQVRKMTEDLSFTFRHPTNFYLLANAEQSGYEFMDDSVMNNKGQHLQVYRKVLHKDEEWHLSKDAQAELVVFQQQSGLQPAFDLKKTDTYKANEATNYQSMAKVDFQKQDRLQYTENNGWMEFEIKVGVADVYALTLKYHNASKETKQATIELITMDDVVLKPAEQVRLEPTREGKWNYIDTDTGTMINAGTYRIRVKSIDAKDIYIDAVDVK
ncbi:malectin domain-containing carbohydrate-binding protein [Sphingobacterium chuzhouense]|uniref:Beta galactosidase jelly roll domain-containing protein n=1 Tax=Sphingobacterium chuzhouense TaxID=1742264 RepID=A0ABR7XQP0_9SPHI|nr:malectin domain-containing carbohydrate-binding protein [Sphingobacterium chuzhouense]MBD1420587.1 beta galactosidase jelly roll domain-containing protein [Sphingobacterium chuzhouense]